MGFVPPLYSESGLTRACDHQELFLGRRDTAVLLVLPESFAHLAQ